MKTLLKKSLFVFALVSASFLLNLNAYATQEKSNPKDKTTIKAQEAVNNASPDDWKTLAVNAEKCIKKNVNLKEASEWLDRSLEIKEDAYNLRVKGDYYYQNNLPEKALDYYIKSIRSGLANDINYVDTETQLKITEISKKA